MTYQDALKELLGELGEATVEWLNQNTTNEEFYEQPMNIHQQDRFLIEHAISMYNQMTRQSKNLYSKQVDGKWVYEPPHNKDQIAQVALLHVLGSIGKLKKEIRNRKIDGKWQEVEEWWYDENRQIFGNDGQQAMMVINDIVLEHGLEPLDRKVEVAILHMHESPADASRGGMIARIFKSNELCLIAHLADMADTYKGE